MRSIHRQLVVSLLVSLIALLAVLELSLYGYIRGRLEGDFDQSLTSRLDGAAQGFQRMAERFGLDLREPPGGRGFRSPFVSYFQIWDHEGQVLARSSSLEGEDLEVPTLETGEPLAYDLLLPEGVPGRAVGLQFTVSIDPNLRHQREREWERDRDRRRGRPRPEDSLGMGRPRPRPGDSDFVADARPPRPRWPDSLSGFGPERPRPENDSAVIQSRSFSMVLARSREDLDSTMSTIALGLGLFGLLLPGAAALCVLVSVRRGLRPLSRLTRKAEAIRPSQLHHRFELAGLPAELQPLARRLNQLLGRLEQAFQREKRFTADVAHELRTPIAELRSLAEVGLDWEEADGSPQPYFQDALEIATRMNHLVGTLLQLVRSEAGNLKPQLSELDLVPLLHSTWRQPAEQAELRGLSCDFELPERAMVCSDATLLAALFGNLFSNAAAYAPEGGSIRCQLSTRGTDWCFELSNDRGALEDDDLAHISDPFWRKDAARTDGAHCGLGLALVSAHARVLGARFKVELQAELFVARLLLPGNTRAAPRLGPRPQPAAV